MLLPVNCEMSEWTKCSASCGPEDQTREILTQPKNGGTKCGDLKKSCYHPACKGKF